MYSEHGTLRLNDIRQRTWLQHPRDPGTDRPNRRLYWWLLPALCFSALVNIVLAGYLDAPMAWLFPRLHMPEYADSSKLADPQFVGQWWLLGVALTSMLFNYFLGEEFLFRGVLLPKMQGVFGKYDWVAIAVLCGLYHLHKPWALPSIIVLRAGPTNLSRRRRRNVLEPERGSAVEAASPVGI